MSSDELATEVLELIFLAAAGVVGVLVALRSRGSDLYWIGAALFLLAIVGFIHLLS